MTATSEGDSAGRADTRHSLIGDGAGHNADGIRLPNAWSVTVGGGHALCRCGALSPDLASRNARRAWHRAHRADLAQLPPDPPPGPEPWADPADDF